MNYKIITSTLLILLSTTLSFSQYSAKMDSTFNNDGELVQSYLLSYNSIIAAKALPDSTLIYSILTVGGSSPTALIKLKFDGTIDSSFAINGILNYSIGGTGTTVYEIEKFGNNLFLSGKVNRDKFVTKIDFNGKIDSTFGTNGSTSVNYSTPIVSSTNSFAMDKIGNIYFGARRTSLSSGITEIIITKLNGVTGLIDNTFGTSGQAFFNLSTGAISAFSDLIVDSAQNIIASCCGSNTTNNVSLVIKFNPNGTLNTSFNGTGFAQYTFPGADVFQVATNKLEVDKNKIIVIGSYLTSGNPSTFVMKIKPDAKFDSTFATNGKLLYSNGAYKCRPSDNLILSDKRILISGTAGLGSTDSYVSLLMLHPNGTVDNSFAANGMFLNQMGTRWESNGSKCLSKYPDNRVFIGGSSSDCNTGICYFTPSMSRVVFDTAFIDVIDTTNHAGIFELNKQQDLDFYPNPIVAGSTIKFNTNQLINKVEVYSINGSLVFSTNLSSTSFKLPSEIKKGLYMVSFSSENSKITKKLIVE